MKDIERNQGVESESAVLVGVFLSDQPNDDEAPGRARRPRRNGRGRSRRPPHPTPRHARRRPPISARASSSNSSEWSRPPKPSVVIFDNDLSAAQIRNLETALGVKVLDRTEVILDIFSTRAQTHEARLAVELAQLEYSLPRLKRMWTHLSRIKAGVGMRGPGEKQLETDRRLVERRIVELRTRPRQGAPPQGARSRRPCRPDDRLARRLHERRQEHAAQQTHRRSRIRRRQAIRHARHAHPPLAVARLGPGAAFGHGRFHPRLASPVDRQLQGDAGRSPSGRPAAARRRRQQSRGLAANCGRLPRARRARHPREGHDPGAEPGRPHHASRACSTRCCATIRMRSRSARRRARARRDWPPP